MSKLISDDYLTQQLQLHANPNYGSMSIKRAEEVAQLAGYLNATKILDYGAGKQKLLPGLKEAGFEGWYSAYDPAVLQIRNMPKGDHDLLVCIDVLEHIEPDLLDNVLDHMKEHTTRFAYITVATGPAKKTLPDGRNAHLIQCPWEWWEEHLEKRWNVQKVTFEESGRYRGFKCWCTDKGIPKEFISVPNQEI